MDTFIVQGIEVDEARVEWLRSWIQEHEQWSRKRLARELCTLWDWRNRRGCLKDFAARSFLLKLEAGRWIKLPRLQEQMRRMPKTVAELSDWESPPLWEGSLEDLGPVKLEVVQPGSFEAKRWAYLLDRHHYLGFRVVGENVGYLASEGRGREVGCLLFGAPAWRCRARDAHLKWTEQERKKGLWRLASNTRFLVLPWFRAKGLASHLLGLAARRISRDWQNKYGHGLDWLETFVDTARYEGICYRAANWRHVGQTTGRSRQDREHRIKVSSKAVYLYRLNA